MARAADDAVPEEVTRWVEDLLDAERRGEAMSQLSKHRDSYPMLPHLLWYSCGTVTALLQEVISVYPALSPPALTEDASNRVCNALALLQCVASEAETRTFFIEAHIPLYLYPFLSTVHKGKPFEYLRLTSLGVLGALVKQDDPAVVEFLLKTEIVPLCLRIMDNGTELSRTVATFIMQKIMQDERGLNFVCASTDRFRVVNTVLSNMVGTLEEAPSPRLLKHVLRCYSRLADHKVAREALRTGLPSGLRRGKLHDLLMSDATLARWLRDLLQAAGEG